MSRRRRIAIGVALALAVLAGAAWAFRGYFTGGVSASLAGQARVEALELPEGLTASLYTDAVPNARSMTRGPDGVLYVGSRGAGNVYAVVDRDGDHTVDVVHVIASGLRQPNGVAYRGGSLWVAEEHRVIRFVDLDARLTSPPEPEVVYETFPVRNQHQWKYLAFGPDGWLYVTVGAPCNICESEDERFATILRMQSDGTGLEVYARGVRNSVGLAWHPETDELWFTDNGRDWLGDDSPPDELNHARAAGLHFRNPYCHGGTIEDPDVSGMPCEETEPPMRRLQPHGASLGLRFYAHDALGERYRGGLLIAQHGSWNRSEPVGYRVMFVPMDEGTPGAPEELVTGWLVGPIAWGRPVDVEVLDDGSVLVSDDGAGAIYRIARR